MISARYEELFTLIAAQIRRSGFEDFVSAGIVLTGGGANIQGAIELAESCFDMPVRLGMPQHVSGLIDVRQNPCFSTGVGLMLHGVKSQENGMPRFDMDRDGTSMWSRMRNWFSGNF